MRLNNSLKNSFTSLISSLLSMLLGFISQVFFIKILGAEYLGLNGLFTNILTILSFFELGIGNAIVFHLYKPIAKQDYKKINILMNFYKKAYTIISVIVFFTGLTFIPFLDKIVGTITIDININIIYILFLINTVSSYLLIYKRNLIYANQKNYISNIIHIIYLIVMNLLQILLLYLTKNYYIYLIIKIICQILENIINGIIASKIYPFLKEKTSEKLDEETKKDVYKKVKALIFHKIGTVFVNGTDNIIISNKLGITIVGIYSNYSLIMSSLNNLLGHVISATTASVGNLLVSDNNNKFNVFKKIRFINFILSSFSAICFFIIIEPFIKMCFGENFILSKITLIVLVINNFQCTMRSTYNTFKDSAGIWYEDKFIPIIESIINIIFSLILVKNYGLMGVFLGTFISSLVLWGYSYPKYVYKKLFNRKYSSYLKETLYYFILFLLLLQISNIITKYITIENIIVNLLISIVLAILITSIYIYIMFRTNEDYNYYKKLIKEKFIKRKK